MHLVPSQTTFSQNPTPGYLPVLLTPFVGRQREVEEVCQLVNNSVVRLVTLHGTAGLGKTRLSIAVGERLQESFRDGVFFVNLAPVNKLEQGLVTIARTLGLQDQHQKPLLETLQHYLKRRELLLILDNFEQIIGLGERVAQLLSAAPLLKIIVTSRVVLRLYGEYIYNVPPLELLQSVDFESVERPAFEALLQNEAVSLFCQRATMVNPEFDLSEENIATVARLCAYLEGIPLAIELAAARCDLFSPRVLLERFETGRRLELLVGGFSNLPPRHQTLANALEWSYQLLNEREKDLFRKLGVFVGSCSLEAASAISGDPASVLETVVSLINKSLLKQVEVTTGEELRFIMLETIREYALEKLLESGELAATRAAQSHYIIGLVETGTDRLKKPDQLVWLKRLSADHDDILYTLDYLIENREVKEAYRLGGNIWLAWWRWGYLNQGWQWLNRILALPEVGIESGLRAKVLDGLAYMALYQSDFRNAQYYFEESIKLWRENEVSEQLGRAISGLAGTYRIMGKYEEALKLNYESLELFQAVGAEVSLADSLCNIGWQLMERGKYEPVQAMLEESLALHTKSSYFTGIARTKIYLGDYHWRHNEALLAIKYLKEAIELLKELNHKIQLPKGLSRLGIIYLCEGDLGLAEKVLEENIEISEEMNTRIDLSYAYSSLGLLRMVQNDLDGAEACFQQAIKLRSEIGQFEGVLWALEGSAVVAIKQGDYTRAEELMTEARLLRQATCAPVLPHTAKYILPVWLEFERTAYFNSNLTRVETVLEFEKRKEEDSATPVAPPSQPAEVGLETAIALSRRESEVLKLVAQGYSNNQIANLLVISAGTVNNHLTSIYSKLGVNSRTAAIRYALDHSLL
ncbi:MAG TPA: tetratricopeptide repeat protein [Chloroflexia bacterium]|nr:tetratricopeptide repeat protein [Chloroflexia bacterium]